MAFREVKVLDIYDVLRAWQSGKGQRSIAALVVVDRKTVRRYLDAAVALGLTREAGNTALTQLPRKHPPKFRFLAISGQKCQ